MTNFTENFEKVTSQQKPTRALEMWKYAPLERIFQNDWTTSSATGFSAEQAEQIKNELRADFINIVFVNGSFQQGLSTKNLPLEVKKSPVSTELSTRRQKHLAKAYSDAELSFEKLNLKSGEAWDISIPANAVIPKPICISHWNFASAPTMHQARLQLNVGPGASVELVESYQSEGQSFTNTFVSIQVQDSAKLQYMRYQADGLDCCNLGSTSIYLAKNSQFSSLCLATGATWSRHFLSVFHEEPNSTSKVNGIYLAKGQQQIENYTNIDHIVGSCQSEQVYKGILDGQSRVVFSGRVHIAKDAQLANSAQLNRSLLLSSQAEIDSKPQLEIWADDVKATHGSAIGQLNVEEIFYLQSRAIPKAQAILMLSQAFVNELVLQLENPSLRQWASGKLQKSLQELGMK